MSDVTQYLSQLIILLPPLLVALTLHELAHGYVAWRLGDPTAQQAGRLTLNPIKHLDPLGTLTLIVTQMIGWAKPVPVNPRFFRQPEQGMLLVAIAGPLSNLLLAAISIVLIHLTPFLVSVTPQNMFYILEPLSKMLFISLKINIVLCIFNMIPVPPLDGSRILVCLLPNTLAIKYMKLEKFGFIVILALVFSGALRHIFKPVFQFVLQLLPY